MELQASDDGADTPQERLESAAAVHSIATPTLRAWEHHDF
jgi:hypothetical protein